MEKLPGRGKGGTLWDPARLLCPPHVSDGVVTPETLYSQACSVTLPDNSEQMTGLAMKQVAWPPCSGQEGIS